MQKAEKSPGFWAYELFVLKIEEFYRHYVFSPVRPLSVKITFYNGAHSFLRKFVRIFFTLPRLLEILFGVLHGSERTTPEVTAPRAQQHTPRARAPFAFLCEIQGHERHEHWPHTVEAKRPGRHDPRDLSPSSRAVTGGRNYAEIVLAALRASPRVPDLAKIRTKTAARSVIWRITISPTKTPRKTRGSVQISLFP